MKLEHQFQNINQLNNHRLVDMDRKDLHGITNYVGYRTPAIWEHSQFDETRSYYVGVTDYFRGSWEFPDPQLVYYVCGLPKARLDESQYVMLQNAWRYLEIFVESVPLSVSSEAAKESANKTPLQRLKDFHAFLGKMIEDKERNA